MTRKELIEKILECKEYLYSDNWESTICDVCNLLIDYENETQDYGLENYTYTFTSSDIIEDYIIHRFKKCGLSQVARDLEGIDSDDDYYEIDDTYWGIYTVGKDRVEEWINDILNELWYEPEEEEQQEEIDKPAEE